MDPEKALKTGEKWGETLGKAIFGVTDVLRDGKNMKAAANAKRLNDNAKIAAQNAVTRAKNEAYMKKKQEEELNMCMVGNFGSVHDIWAFGYRLPYESAVFLGTMAALLLVALICIALKL